MADGSPGAATRAKEAPRAASKRVSTPNFIDLSTQPQSPEARPMVRRRRFVVESSSPVQGDGGPPPCTGEGFTKEGSYGDTDTAALFNFSAINQPDTAALFDVLSGDDGDLPTISQLFRPGYKKVKDPPENIPEPPSSYGSLPEEAWGDVEGLQAEVGGVGNPIIIDDEERHIPSSSLYSEPIDELDRCAFKALKGR